MFRTLLVSLLAACLQASRVEVETHDAGKSKLKARSRASCDELETMFHTRVVAFQHSLDANPDLDSMSAAGRVRVTMKTFGIIRTLRRARACSWVIENDSEDIDRTRAIVQTLLNGNPCSEVARSELEAGISANTAELEIQSLRRAMSVLSSGNCEVGEAPGSPEEVASMNDDADVDAALHEVEAEVQDVLDEVQEALGEDEAEVNEVDAASREVEAEVGAAGSFIQMGSKSKIGGVLRSIGVAFLMLFLLLACTGVIVVIAALITYAFAMLLQIGSNPAFFNPTVGNAVVAFAGAGAALEFATCSYRVYTRLLPQPTNSTA